MKIRICSIKELSSNDKNRMFQIMTQYYECMVRETFDSDLSEKTDVILLLDRNNEIQGFSTLLLQENSEKGRRYITIFSGDTVLDRQYWGNGALATAFGKYLLRVKLQNPFTDVYWLLISKGFKTYLLMTNNFPVHYPRHERKTAAIAQTVMDKFYSQRFGKAYFPNDGLIRFSKEKASYIKDFNQEIGEQERLNPRVAFFEAKNPKWFQGEELACIAQVTLWIPFRYMFKRLFKLLGLARASSAKAAGVKTLRSI